MEYTDPITPLPSLTELDSSVFNVESFAPKDKFWYDASLYSAACLKHVMNIRANLLRFMSDEDLSNDAALDGLFDAHGPVAIEFFTNVLGEYYAILGLQCNLLVPTMDERHVHHISALSRWCETDEFPACVVNYDDRLIHVNGKWFKIVRNDDNGAPRPESESCSILHREYKALSSDFQSTLEKHYDISISSLPGFLASFRPRQISDEHLNKCNKCIDARLRHVLECVNYMRRDRKVLVHADLANIMFAIRSALRRGRISWNKRRRTS